MLDFPLQYALEKEKFHFRIIAYHHMLLQKCEDSKHENMLKFIISVHSLNDLSIL